MSVCLKGDEGLRVKGEEKFTVKDGVLGVMNTLSDMINKLWMKEMELLWVELVFVVVLKKDCNAPNRFACNN